MKLSHSGINTMLACEHKFASRYVYKTPVDSDYVDSKALHFGKAFHKILENCKHDYKLCTTGMMREVCNDFSLAWDNDGAKIASCLRSYFAGQDPKWKCIHTEVGFETDDHKGFIDAIFEHVDDKRWRIGDNKTSGVKLEVAIKAKLINDQQMNMYVWHAPFIALMLGLDIDKFDGISYREVEKPRHRWKPDIKERHEDLELSSSSTEDVEFYKPTVTVTTRPETWAEFTQRCGEPPYRETVLLRHEFIFLDRVVANIMQMTERARALEAIDAVPTRNMQACKQWGSPCPYWSQCYDGKTYTESRAAESAAPTQTISNAGVIEDDADKF